MAYEYKFDFAWKSEPRKPKEILPQLWYKERLKTKYLKDKKQIIFSDSLNGHRWRFLRPELDDCPDEYSYSEDEALTKSHKGLSPVLYNVPQVFKPRRQRPQKLSKEQICYSKIPPLQHLKRLQIEEIEYGLTQHPLALYQHLEDGIPPELFEDIVRIMDPEMLQYGDDVFSEKSDDIKKASESNFKNIFALMDDDVSMHTGSKLRQIALEESRRKNPYKWLLLREAAKKESKKVKPQTFTSKPLEEELEQITKEFCEWVTSLGGETNNIDESTVRGLFANSYESKASLIVPINVMELTNIPPELRKSVGVPSVMSSLKPNLSRLDPNFKCIQDSKAKFRYGAWYLDPKTWVKRKYDAPLLEPRFQKDDKPRLIDLINQTAVIQEKKNLKGLYATLAFIDFIDARGARKPEFLQKLLIDGNSKSIEKISIPLHKIEQQRRQAVLQLVGLAIH